MKIYDLYLLSGDSDVIIGWQKFEEPDDKAAIRTAIGLAPAARMELWSNTELIKRWG